MSLTLYPSNIQGQGLVSTQNDTELSLALGDMFQELQPNLA